MILVRSALRRSALVLRLGLPAFAATLAPLLLAGAARADVDGGSEDLQALEKRLGDEAKALSTSDCASACRALASIRRAADKICALDPEERCVAARAKADDATRRVRDACPDCALASAPLPSPPRDERARTKAGREPAETPTSAVQAAPSESGRGGCASCTTSGASGSDLGTAAVAALALSLVMRRRERKRS